MDICEILPLKEIFKKMTAGWNLIQNGVLSFWIYYHPDMSVIVKNELISHIEREINKKINRWNIIHEDPVGDGNYIL